jgi:hypothetical protein
MYHLFELAMANVGRMVLVAVVLGAITTVVWVHTLSTRTRRTAEQSTMTATSSLPSLDTSRMFFVGKHGQLCGMFSSRYYFMVVANTNGKLYVCFMTEHNIRALAAAGFKQEDMWVPIYEYGPTVVVDGVRCDVYPEVLRHEPEGNVRWQEWAALRQEFSSENIGSRYQKVFWRHFGNNGEGLSA